MGDFRLAPQELQASYEALAALRVLCVTIKILFGIHMKLFRSFSVLLLLWRKKNTKHKQLGILRNWARVKTFAVGEKETDTQHPQKVPGQSCEKGVYVFRCLVVLSHSITLDYSGWFSACSFSWPYDWRCVCCCSASRHNFLGSQVHVKDSEAQLLHTLAPEKLSRTFFCFLNQFPQNLHLNTF